MWWGFLVPAHTPSEIVMRLNKEIDTALQDQKVRDSLVAMGATVKGGSPDEFRTFLKSETEKWATMIRKAKIKAD